jgi:hypothetical protein
MSSVCRGGISGVCLASPVGTRIQNAVGSGSMSSVCQGGISGVCLASPVGTRIQNA